MGKEISRREFLPSGFATQCEAQSSADFVHSQGTQLSHALSQSMLGNGNCIVQVHCARCFHAILLIQRHLRWHIADRGRDWCDSDRRQIKNGAAASKDDHWPFLVRRSELIKSDIPSGYSAGHAASASQMRDSSRVCGCFEEPSRSRSSQARISNFRRCSRSASRTNAERFRFVRRAA